MRIRVLLGCLLVAGCGSFEEVITEGSLRGEASLNPLLASQRFFERMGLPATSSGSLPQALPEDAVVLVSGQRYRATTPALEHLLEWVAGGGHALVFVEGFDEPLPPGAGDPEVPFALLERLGVVRGPAPDYDEFFEGTDSAFEEDPTGREEWELQLDPDAGCIGPENDLSTPVCDLSYGDGKVTLIPEGSIIARKNLGDGDHAAWLWSTVQAGPQSPTSALLIHGGGDTLWSLIRKHAPAAPWALLGLLVLSLWRLAVRFGPRLPDPPPARLGFDLHVTAVGKFLWKRRENTRLVQAWRNRVLNAARGKLGLPLSPGSDPTRTQGFVDALVERTQLPADRIQRAFASEHVDESATFTAIIADLQAMRQAL